MYRHKCKEKKILNINAGRVSLPDLYWIRLLTRPGIKLRRDQARSTQTSRLCIPPLLYLRFFLKDSFVLPFIMSEMPFIWLFKFSGSTGHGARILTLDNREVKVVFPENRCLERFLVSPHSRQSFFLLKDFNAMLSVCLSLVSFRSKG